MKKHELLFYLKKRGFSESIIKAFENVKREEFVPDNLRDYAYDDNALEIGHGQTISQPSTIAFMLFLLELKESPNQKILEIGSGSGYVLALLNEITKAGEIYGIEIKKPLAESSSSLLSKHANILIISRSGFSGLPEKAPFDRILISASAPSLSIAVKLSGQLKDNGVLVSPVQNSIFQMKKYGDNIKMREYESFAFVPLVEK